MLTTTSTYRLNLHNYLLHGAVPQEDYWRITGELIDLWEMIVHHISEQQPNSVNGVRRGNGKLSKGIWKAI